MNNTTDDNTNKIEIPDRQAIQTGKLFKRKRRSIPLDYPWPWEPTSHRNVCISSHIETAKFDGIWWANKSRNSKIRVSKGNLERELMRFDRNGGKKYRLGIRAKQLHGSLHEFVPRCNVNHRIEFDSKTQEQEIESSDFYRGFRCFLALTKKFRFRKKWVRAFRGVHQVRPPWWPTGDPPKWKSVARPVKWSVFLYLTSKPLGRTLKKKKRAYS